MVLFILFQLNACVVSCVEIYFCWLLLEKYVTLDTILVAQDYIFKQSSELPCISLFLVTSLL